MHRLLVAATAAALALAAVACTGGIEGSTEALDSPSTTPSPSASVPSAGTIVVRAPMPGDDVVSPVVVSGSARTASGEVLVRVLARDGTELAAMNTPIDCGDACRGTFRAALAFYAPSRQPGAVQVLEVGQGGSAEHLVEVPVRLVPGV
ncbi:MAG TPA: Gmad2 immunoglobulin-like domain-containing protein [Actinomycetota bacterium]|nr:Gmad2 immunoglobulin-like domain-containing protein [Actinomycetota bacterium]